MFDKLAETQEKYSSTRTHLIKKKQRLFEEGNMAKWEMTSVPSQKPAKNEAFKIMLPK